MASTSIDVLGLQTGYLALANRILPGFTTVTTSPRYLSMLCAASAIAEREIDGSGFAASRQREQRLHLIRSTR